MQFLEYVLRNMEILYRISPEEKIQMFTHDERQVMANAHMAWPGEVMKMFNIKPYFPLLSK
jgi:hypothetical protein